MNRQCKECYWLSYNNKECIQLHDLNDENCCDFTHQCCNCDTEHAEYKYKGEMYCIHCLFDKLEVDTHTTEHYYIDGDYIGSDDDIDNVIDNLKCDYDIEELEE